MTAILQAIKDWLQKLYVEFYNVEGRITEPTASEFIEWLFARIDAMIKQSEPEDVPAPVIAPTETATETPQLPTHITEKESLYD